MNLNRLPRPSVLLVVPTLLLAAVLPAQVVKAPRYESSTVNAPAQQVKLPTPAAITPGATVVEDVIVRVNDQIINRSDLERSQQQLEQEIVQSNIPAAEAEQRRKDMLRDMIDQQLLLSRGKELGINADAELVRRLDDIRKQNKMDSLDQLEAAAKAQGVSYEDFKAQIRNSVITQQVVRDEVGRRLQMTQAQEQAYYDAHKSEFQQPEQVRLSEILIPVGADATPEAVAEAQAKANDIKTRVMAPGASFDAIARQYSGGPTAAQGGELGLFKRGVLAKVLEDQTFNLKPGESTQPIRTRQGFVILKVTEHQSAGVAPLKDVEQQVQEAMYMGQMQPALRTYLTKLREESYIDLKPGFIDSGASSNETKPVFTAYAPPVPKKKKVTEKKRFERNGYYAQASLKKDVVAGPDTTGGRTLTGAEAAPLIDAKTGLAILPAGSGTASTSPVILGKNGKPRKIKREKVRFGQAPQESLGPGPVQVADATPPAPSTAGPAGAGIGPLVAPGAVMASDPVSTSSTPAQEDPLAPAPPALKKTRFADRQATLQQEKLKKVSAKQQEKIAATPVAMTSEEKTAARTQAAPLGLNGDTGKQKKVKVKKVKHKKGDPKPEKAPKERMQERANSEPQAPAQPAPTASPALAPVGLSDTPASSANSATPSNSAAPVPQRAADQTTLPPANAPVPGANPTGQPVPGTQPPE